jgi:hypothetical protein
VVVPSRVPALSLITVHTKANQSPGTDPLLLERDHSFLWPSITTEMVDGPKPSESFPFVLHDLARKPIAGAQCELRVESEAQQLTTNGEGMIQQDIPPGAESSGLVVKAPTVVGKAMPLPMPVRIGHLGQMAAAASQDRYRGSRVERRPRSKWRSA